jgi:hypothetical protein
VELKPGQRLASQVSDTEFVVIKGSGEHDLSCGGSPAVPVGDALAHQGSGDAEGVSLMGKRYTDADATVEILCTKPGGGALTLDGTALVLKESKPLPSSD